MLVCTLCAEEGVDVAACAFVLRFSKFDTTKSHKQGAGRARQPNAEIIYMENDPVEECDREDMMNSVACNPTFGISTEELSSAARDTA